MTLQPPNLRNAQLLYISFALHLSILIYLFVLHQLSDGEGWTREWRIIPDKLLMVQILTILSFLKAGLAIFWPRLFMKDDSPDLPRPMISQSTKPLIFDFRNVDQKIQTATIVRMALAEAACIYGFVAALLNQSFLLGVPYFVGALVVQFYVGAIFGRLRSS